MFKAIQSRGLVQLAAAVLFWFAADTTVVAADWIQVHKGKLYNISGMALLDQGMDHTDFVVVHDNKKSGEPRFGAVRASSERVLYRTLDWPNPDDLPNDLESLTTVPDQPGEFLALTSDGRLFSLALAGKNLIVQSDFMLPELTPETNIEGFSVQRLANQLVAVWGHRGAGDERGQLYWGLLDLKLKRMTAVSKAEIAVPSPSSSDPNTRHIADLKIDTNGVIWASATSDPGDDGPYLSVIYTLGVLRVEASGEVQFERNHQLTRLWTFSRKVEAMEWVPGPLGAIAFGTDDENDGGWLYFQSTWPGLGKTVSAASSQ